jgi:serine/threonine-protein kinase RsbW
MMRMQRFLYNSSLESENKMYDDVRKFLSDGGIGGIMLFKVLLAVSEAFTNALVHGNSLNPKKVIELSLEVNDRLVKADIIDEGAGEIDDLISRKPPDQLQEGGRGVDLMEHIADDFNASKHKKTGGLHISMIFERDKYQLCSKSK